MNEATHRQATQASQESYAEFLARLLTVKQFSQKYKPWTEPAMRGLIYKAEPRESTKGRIEGNGLIEAGAIIRLGRKVLIDEGKFFGWVRASSRRGR